MMLQNFVDGQRDITDVLDTNSGEKYYQDKATGQRIHPLEMEAARLLEVNHGLQAEIDQTRAKIMNDPGLNDKGRQDRVTERVTPMEANRQAYMDGKLGEMYQRGSAEFEAINGELQAQMSLNKDGVRQKMTPVLDAASKELAGEVFRNLGELEAFYQKALKTDPTLAYAIELEGKVIAKRIDPNNPQNGSWAKRLERAKLARGENDQTRAQLAKLQTLHAGVNAAATAANRLHRQTSGATIPQGASWARQIQELAWSIGNTLAEQTGGPVIGDESGAHGGVYMPTVAGIFGG